MHRSSIERRLEPLGPGPKIKSKITIKMGKAGGTHSRGHFTRKPVRTSVNTGDFDHLTRKITRKDRKPTRKVVFS